MDGSNHQNDMLAHAKSLNNQRLSSLTIASIQGCLKYQKDERICMQTFEKHEYNPLHSFNIGRSIYKSQGYDSLNDILRSHTPQMALRNQNAK